MKKKLFEQSEFIPSPLRLRFVALLLDFIVILAYVGVLAGLALLTFHCIIGHIPSFSVNVAHIIGFLTLTGPVVAYFIFSEQRPRHASLGKRLAKLEVHSIHNLPLTTKQVVVRNTKIGRASCRERV